MLFIAVSIDLDTQHDVREAEHRAGPSAIADTCYVSCVTAYTVHYRLVASRGLSLAHF